MFHPLNPPYQEKTLSQNKSFVKKGAIEVLATSVDPPLTTRDQHSPLSHNNMLGDKVGGVWLKTGVYLENLNRRSISQGV
jgi:hypothetical protein